MPLGRPLAEYDDLRGRLAPRAETMPKPDSPPAAVAQDDAIELSVIAPCLNEELNLPELARRVLRVFEVGGLRGELVVVDDGSTDGTASVLRALEQAHPKGGPRSVVGVYHPKNRGMAAGWRSAALVTRGKLVATIDADLQYQPEDLLRLRRALTDHAVDIVQGYRSSVGRDRDHRYYLSRGLNYLLNGVFSMHLTDNKSGFVMCAREVFLDLLGYQGSYFYWQSFVMVAAHAKGYSYKEIESIFEQRRQGKSFLDGKAVSASARSLFDVARAAWEYRLTAPPADVATQFLRRFPPATTGPQEGPSDPAHEARWQAYLATFPRTHWMLTRDVVPYYETLGRTQWLDAAATRELQDEKLRRLVRHAYRNVPYYRARMKEARVHPDDIRGQADLPRLPLLSKAEVREQLYFDIMSENHDKTQVLRLTTSGATGEPFVCYADRAQLELRWAANLRAQEWTGYRFGDPTVQLWEGDLGLTPAQASRDRADARFSNRTRLPVFELSDATLGPMLEALERARPVLLEGHAEALELLARRLRAGGGARPRPKAVLSSSQTLSPDARARLEEAFGCAVFDRYRSREFGGLAHECGAHAGLHVVAEGYIVEVLRDGLPAAPGERGEVVVTDLTNYCMPFLRYRLGDHAELLDPAVPCPCGRGAPRLGAIEGREPSIVRGTGGRYLPGTFFAHYLRDFDHAIRRFQVVQQEAGALTFRLVKAGRFSPQVVDEVVTAFRRHLGEGTRVDVEVLDALPAGPPVQVTLPPPFS